MLSTDQKRLLLEAITDWTMADENELKSIPGYLYHSISVLAFWANKHLEPNFFDTDDMPPKGSDEMRMGIWLEDNYDRVVLGLEKLKESEI